MAIYAAVLALAACGPPAQEDPRPTQGPSLPSATEGEAPRTGDDTDRGTPENPVGVDLLLLGFLHVQEDVERFGTEVIPLVRELEREAGLVAS